MKILFTCGGTGGHIYPLIALYNEFKKQNIDFEYLFVGSTYGLEKEIFEKEEIKNVSFLNSRGIKRNLSLSNFKSIFYNIISFKKAQKIIKEFKPDIVIGTGGYPAFHMTYFASKMKISYFIIESNALPGLVTKLFYKKAKYVFVSTEFIKKYFDNIHNIKVLGVPTRENKIEKTKEEICKEYNLKTDRKIITIIGGSCGAEKINEATINLVKNCSLEYQIIFVTGKKYFNDIISKMDNIPSNVKIIDYINNMPEILSIADMIVSRAGAMTISEIKAFEIPALVIPFKKATSNHQYFNAIELEELGVAKVIKEEDINEDVLREMIENILLNEMNFLKMKENFKKIEKKDSNYLICRCIMEDIC